MHPPGQEVIVTKFVYLEVAVTMLVEVLREHKLFEHEVIVATVVER